MLRYSIMSNRSSCRVLRTLGMDVKCDEEPRQESIVANTNTDKCKTREQYIKELSNILDDEKNVLLKKLSNNPVRANIKIKDQEQTLYVASQHIGDRFKNTVNLFRELYLKEELQKYQIYKNETTSIKPIINLIEETIIKDSIKITFLNNKMTVKLYTANHLGEVVGYYILKFIDVGASGFTYSI
jgi:hypothetical protein